MTCQDLIKRHLFDTKDKAFQENAWGKRHVAAWYGPRANELGIKRLIQALATLADAWPPIGEDHYASEYWLDCARAALALLNMDLGRFDGGTLDKLIRDMAVLAKV